MIVIRFPPPAPTLNMNDRKHWAAKAKAAAAWREAAGWAAHDAANNGLQRNQPFSVVQLVIPVRSLKVRRDPSNWYPTVKAVVDGLVDAGVFADDSSKHLATVEPEFKQGGYVEVHIKEAGS